MKTFTSRQLRKLSLVSAVALAAGLAGLAHGDTDTMSVEATVPVSCNIDSVASISGASYDPIVANKTADMTTTGTINVTCTNGSTATVALGDGASHNTTNRRMKATVELEEVFLNYDLYTDDGHTTVWNDTDSLVTHNGTGVSQAHTAYMKVPADQNTVKAATYSDSVAVTVSF